MADGSSNEQDIAAYLIEVWRTECRRHGDEDQTWPGPQSTAVAEALTGSFPTDDEQLRALESAARAFLATGEREWARWRLEVLDRVLRAGGSAYGLTAIEHLLTAEPEPEPEPTPVEAPAVAEVPAPPEPTVVEAPPQPVAEVPAPPEPAVVEAPAQPAAEIPPAPVVAEAPAQPEAEAPAQPEVPVPAQPVAEVPAQPVAEIPPQPVVAEAPAQPVVAEAPAQPVVAEAPAQPVAEAPAQPVAPTPAQPVTEVPAQPEPIVAEAAPAAAPVVTPPVAEAPPEAAPVIATPEPKVTVPPVTAPEPEPELVSVQPVAVVEAPPVAAAPTEPEPVAPEPAPAEPVLTLVEAEPAPIGAAAEVVVGPPAEPAPPAAAAVAQGLRGMPEPPWPDEFESVPAPTATISTTPVAEDTELSEPTRSGVGVSVADRATFEATVCTLVDDRSEFTVAFVGLDEVSGPSLGVPDDSGANQAEEAACRALLWSLARRTADRGTCYSIGRGLVAVILDRGRPKDIDKLVKRLPAAEVASSFSWGAARFPDEANDVRELLRMALVRLANMREEKLTPRILVSRLRRAVSSRS